MFAIKHDLISTLNEADVEVLSESEAIINDSIRKAIELTKSHIQHRYDIDAVFPDFLEFGIATVYVVGDIIYHVGTSWSSGTTYALNDRVNYLGKVYKSLQAANLNKNPLTETAWWSYVYDEYEKFTCVKNSTGFWPDNTEYWENNDSRNTVILDAVTVIALYNLFRKVQPTNIPEWITTELERQETILKEIGNGKRTIILTVKVDEDDEPEGHNITYGSETAKTWDI